MPAPFRKGWPKLMELRHQSGDSDLRSARNRTLFGINWSFFSVRTAMFGHYSSTPKLGHSSSQEGRNDASPTGNRRSQLSMGHGQSRPAPGKSPREGPKGAGQGQPTRFRVDRGQCAGRCPRRRSSGRCTAVPGPVRHAPSDPKRRDGRVTRSASGSASASSRCSGGARPSGRRARRSTGEWSAWGGCSRSRKRRTTWSG